MLVFKRKIDQSIFISNDIRVCLVGLGENWAKIGVEAPRFVKVNRDDVGPDRSENHSLEVSEDVFWVASNYLRDLAAMDPPAVSALEENPINSVPLALARALSLLGGVPALERIRKQLLSK